MRKGGQERMHLHERVCIYKERDAETEKEREIGRGGERERERETEREAYAPTELGLLAMWILLMSRIFS